MHNEAHSFFKSLARLFHPEGLAGPVQDPRTFSTGKYYMYLLVSKNVPP